MKFNVDVHQNDYLPAGAAEIHAVVTVCAEGAGQQADAAEIIIIDVSGSMDQPATKLRSAKDATIAAIDCLRDGVRFGVVAGTEFAQQVYPPAGPLVAVSAASRKDAIREVARLKAGGGTAMGQWLAMAKQLLEVDPAPIKHAILLTDGRNESESRRQFRAVLKACEGVFQCDSRGIGDQWEVRDLREISEVLLGSFDLVAKPEHLADDFETMIRWAMGKQTANVMLRLWTPLDAKTSFVRQVVPEIVDFTARGSPVSEREVDYPTGSWGDECRDYHLCIAVPARAVGEEMLAGRVSAIVDGESVAKGLIKVIWTDATELSTRIDRKVAMHSGQEELASAIAEGLKARREGDDELATAKLGRAVQLAAQDGNEDKIKDLANVVEIEDPVTGKIRLKSHVSREDEMSLETRSTKTQRLRKPDP